MSSVLDELSREVEQAEAGVESFANSVSIFWNQLRKQGLTRKEATELSGIWLNSIIISTIKNAGNNTD